MPERTLRQILEELHARLSESEDLDPESRRALEAASAEIHEALDAEDHSRVSGGMRERLSEALAEFESSHPRLTESVKRLVDQLADMGI